MNEYLKKELGKSNKQIAKAKVELEELKNSVQDAKTDSANLNQSSVGYEEEEEAI
ncbi:17253_t:CDS:2, partial [Entrophospora sp. SA101]